MDSGRITSDPATAHCRIYVGGINPEMDPEPLEKFFKKFGEVIAMKVYRGYGFVQFKTEEEAQAALKDGANRTINGVNCVLRTAVKNFKFQSGYPNEDEFDGPYGPMRGGPRGGMRGGPRGFRGGFRGRGRPPMPPFHDDGPPDAKRPRGPPGRDWSPPGRDGRGPRRYDYEEEEEYGRRGYRGGPPPPYAEEVEDRLKNVGLAVDMLFPRAGAPINQVLDQISSRGTLYAVVVHPTNEQHRSVSLNIMHGNPPQEHRNMPLDDAMSLVARNFEAYMLSNKDKAPPQGIINLLNFVRENRPLTAVEYNRLIRYLEEKRDHQLKPEKSSLSALTPSIAAMAPKPVPAPVVSVATPSQQQIDLQQKILSMMQAYKTQQPTSLPVGTAPVTGPVPAPVMAPPPVQSWTTTDPSAAAGAGMSRVKSAIDSLVTSGPNLLKMEQDNQQQQYGGGYGYNAQASSLGQAPTNPLFGAYANQRY
ncbi:Nuclear receptor coactivator 5 [Amphibalanus amphitrite]|uniref:Nuclear receptor coactivator 5 n=1 Tax=Amphibalanus amphitrite TaxID=1232801 RepID=A0A6A4W449_AMPAM|nr:Nuclear receptor coactivator 5 [Amphibalanus amphitrite]KAF0302657.1 Nuclear receptor coactivator 5 [Amphibalanus amphitrite]